MTVPVLTHAQSRRRIQELRERGCDVAVVTYSSGNKHVFKKCSPLLENPIEPNIFGYLVLAGFGAALLYAIFRPRPATAAVAAPSAPTGGCPLETAEDFARLEAWATEKKIPVVYLPAQATPPAPESNLLTQSFVRSRIGVVVVTSDGSFWTYDSGQPLPSTTYREDFCNYRPGTLSGVTWIN